MPAYEEPPVSPGGSFFVDPGIGAGADHRPGIGGVHNGIGAHIGNVVSYDLKGHRFASYFVSS